MILRLKTMMTTIKRIYRFYDLVYNAETRILESFTLNEDKVNRARRESGFFANTTHGVDFNAMTAQNHYKLLDELCHDERYHGSRPSAELVRTRKGR